MEPTAGRLARPAGGSALQIQPGTVAELREHGGALFEEHYHELVPPARRPDMRLDPDWQAYEALSRVGKLVVLLVWDGPRLVGYSVNHVTTHLHYREYVYAINDVLFVTESMRGAGIYTALAQRTKQALKERGCHRVNWHAKPGTPLDRILGRHATLFESIYTEEL